MSITRVITDIILIIILISTLIFDIQITEMLSKEKVYYQDIEVINDYGLVLISFFFTYFILNMIILVLS